MYPGEIIPAAEPVPLNPGRTRVRLTVRNLADRPVQVGSHYHFAVANPGLEFDRDAAWGQRLDIAAGTAVRFEPGIEREVELVPIGGARTVPGLRPEFAGSLDSVSFDAARLDPIRLDPGRFRDGSSETEDPERSGKDPHD
ncbi:urease subunit beta [Actinopolyspora alba]|uniref:Urease subunit beta n=1 Tax=Actinopolyspora alba TaxID=673379 RepID=A0A1I1ULU5_9ACTN|nr:urease subunit beta [Actinopolyspora alba]SFD71832.1 urease subunit beta [Actinopolyspora alba]